MSCLSKADVVTRNQFSILYDLQENVGLSSCVEEDVNKPVTIIYPVLRIFVLNREETIKIKL